MSAIATTSLIFTIIFLLTVVVGGYYLWYKYPERIKKAAYAGTVRRNRHTDKIEKHLNEEITSLVINESPEMLELFPKSTELAIETGQVPDFVGMLMGKALPFLAKFISSSETVSESPALQMATAAAQTPAVVDTLLGVFSNIFSSREKKPKKKREPKAKYPKTEGNFPDFV